MASGFHDGSRSLQDRFDTRALADRIDDLLVSDTIDEGDRAFIEARVRARAVYPNCPRYIHRYELVRRSRFVPARGCVTPVPQWKRSDWALDALPEHDPAREPGEREVLGR